MLVILGDSNARGSAATADQSAYVAGYVADPKVQVLNVSNVFAQYAPGTLAGLNNLGNHGNVGAEIGFIRRLRAAYPSNTLYIVKLALAGSPCGRGAALRTITGSIAPSTLNTVGTISATNMIVGAGIPTGIAVQSGSSPNWALRKIGDLTAVNLTIASQSMDVYNAANAWVPDESTLWSGLPGSLTNGYRGKSVAGLATLPAPKIVAALNMLGTNDKGLAAPERDHYRSAQEALLAAMKSNWQSLPTASPIVLARVQGADTGSLAIRADQAAIVAAHPRARLKDMDGFATHDGIHFIIAAHDQIGSEIFDAAVF